MRVRPELFPSHAGLGGWQSTVAGARILARLHVLHSGCAAGPDRQGSRGCSGTSGWYCWIRLWLDKGKPHREDAADFVGRFDYNQKPALLCWALIKPMDRVMYIPLAPCKPHFDLLRDLMMETGVLTKRIEFSEYADTRFLDLASNQTPWRYEAGIATVR